MRIHTVLAGALVALATHAAQAFQITNVSPHGEVAQVRQLVVKFDAPAAAFGDAKAAAPVGIECSDPQAARGSGHWTGEREWVFEFDDDLPPGASCTVQPRAGQKSAAGADLTGLRSYRFSTGGPFVTSIRPYSGGRIDEEQYFTLQLNGPATPASVLAHVWCVVDGLGERVPVRAIAGAERAALLKSQGLERAAARTPLRILTLTCNRRLTPAAKVQLVYGKGVASASTATAASGTPATGLPNTTEKRFSFQVREPFTASFSCERENAQAACMPIRAMSLGFNAPVARAVAQGIRLQGGGKSYAPVFDQEDAAPDSLVDSVRFASVLPESTPFTIELPRDFNDVSGRPLRNADSFPLKVASAAMPPLAKFAAAPFGVVERLAEPGGVALLPVTLRKVEAALRVQGLPAAAPPPAGQVSDLRPTSDADIIAWYARVQRYNDYSVSRATAAADVQGPLPKVLGNGDKNEVQTRMLSLLQGQAGVKTLQLPAPQSADPRPFEVVGIPLGPGFHVVEIASPLLGAALLDERHGAGRTMYVRTSVLVTNLGVHFKLGRENALAWVTSLDRGRPVANARVAVSDCSGREVARGTTDAEGRATFTGLDATPPDCVGEHSQGGAYFVSARAKQAGPDGAKDGVEDLAFTWSDWHRGIEPWRFNVPTSRDMRPDDRAHTIFDRMLVRAGETVSMKHLLRTETGGGFTRSENPPTTLVVTHLGSGQQVSQPLAWRSTATGGQSAESSFAVPPGAKLGAYQVELRGSSEDRNYSTGQFRVEEFRLPLLAGRVGTSEKQALVKVQRLPVDVQINYVAGGGAAGLPVKVSALARTKVLDFPDYGEFNFSPPRAARESSQQGEEENTASQDQRVVADKLPLTLDRNGAGRLVLDKLPALPQPQELVLEASYADPNGEIQTLRGEHTLWPAGVLAGIRTEGWVSVSGSAGQKIKFQALALDLTGKPRASVPLEVRALARIVTSSRKRMVGGFYTYDSRTEVKDLGAVCSGKSDSRGLLLCETELRQAGEVELVVTARDDAGNSIQAASSVYVTRQGELWFGSENHDRMDLLPEKKTYEPGETARFQVRMPFRYATALVAVEREGIVDTRVVQLSGQDPSIDLKVQENWGPNVYVSVLALRGRLREVPWYSFFTWGFKAPREWWTSFWYEGREFIAPTTLVDLSKPAFRLGMSEIRVGTRAHRIDMEVKADKATYPVRAQAVVTISAKLPDGRPAAGAEVAVAAVDEALLELMPNTSWNLLEAMLQRRSWGVETSTAQMEIIGRRHYGRKAVAPGGGGGHSGTRELLDTLLLWNPRVVLDAKGQAQVTVPLNDALTTFRVAAVADVGTGQFGTGQTSLRVAQDLQIISGLPPLVREDDRFRAQLTLRNTTQKAMKVEVAPRATLLDLKPQTLDIPAGEAREVGWSVVAPAQLAATRAEAILWEIEAKDSIGGARDALKARQRIVPAVPLAVQQATLVQLDGPYALEVKPPADALPGRGGLKLALQPKLAQSGDGGLPGVRDWFANYPFACLEQKASKAVGLRDIRLWQAMVAQLPSYLDSDGLANYFPPRDGEANRGSDTLTAYLLAMSHEVAGLDPAYALDEAVRAPMERGLIAFVEGRLQRDFWSPRKDLDVRKLAALEALSRHGKAQARMLASITVAPNQWPTHAVIDWISVLRRLPDTPQRDQRLAEANQILRARISTQGTRLVFSTERDDAWWWLMQNADTNAARLLLLAVDDPAWKDDVGRLANGLLGRQNRGAWQTTTANLWGSLALEKFSAKLESVPVAGSTRAVAGAANATLDWSRPERSLFLPWSAAMARDTLTVTHQGTGKPWLTLQSLAAVELKAPFNAGYQVRRSITPVSQADPSLPAGSYTRGDVLRVTLEVNASADMTWVVLSDPVPGGSAILGGGLGRDSPLATQGEKRSGDGWPAFEERGFEAYRAYYEFLPKGVVKLQYTLRLNNVGEFALPPTRVEAMYAPEMFGEAPNARIRVEAAR